MKSIIGKKLGMTQIYDAAGKAVVVTVIEAKPGTVIEVKTADKHGYESMKVGFFADEKAKHYTKPELGVFKKAGVAPHRLLRELPVHAEATVGGQVTLEGFEPGDKVKVSGVSKGKGFQGAMKRHNFNGGPEAHGSMHNRAVGSIGASSYPSRVFKGKRMPGHMGNKRISVMNLRVADVRLEQNLILIEGAVPGAKNAVIEIMKEG